MRRTITKRTAERLIRNAYDLEELASRLRAEGFDSYANGVKASAAELGDMGRGLMNELDR